MGAAASTVIFPRGGLAILHARDNTDARVEHDYLPGVASPCGVGLRLVEYQSSCWGGKGPSGENDRCREQGRVGGFV